MVPSAEIAASRAFGFHQVSSTYRPASSENSTSRDRAPERRHVLGVERPPNTAGSDLWAAIDRVGESAAAGW